MTDMKFVHFRTRDEDKREVHTLETEHSRARWGVKDEYLVRSECNAIGGEGDEALKPGDIDIVEDKWPTCNSCLAAEWSLDPTAERRWLDDYAHDRTTNWKRDSPAPQINRRETY